MARRISPKTFVSNTRQINVWTANQRYNDCVKLQFGDGVDASIFYNQTNLVIKPNDVGCGVVLFQGDITLDGQTYVRLGNFTDAQRACPGAAGRLIWNTCDTKLQVDNGCAWVEIGGGCGDVSGPSSVVDNAIARFNGTTGKIIQGYTSSPPLITDLGAICLAEGQLIFPAIANSSADANTLDDFEKGVWTPGIADNSGDGSGEGQTYSTQVGRYTKNGNRVDITGRLTITSLGTLITAQSALLTGLPFTSVNVSGALSSFQIGRALGLSIAAATTISGIININDTKVILQLWDATVGHTPLTVAEISASGDFIFSATYEV